MPGKVFFLKMVGVWIAGFVGLLAACGGDGRSTASDGGVDGRSPPPPPPTTCTPPGPLCESSCGNGVAETCYRKVAPDYCGFFIAGEACDGTPANTCADLGYYGGTLACTSACTLDNAACEACPPASRCATLAPLSVDRDVVASGSRVAVAGADAVAVFDGLTEIARAPITQVFDLTAVPTGWVVVAADDTLYQLGSDGQLGAPRALWEGAGGSRLAYAGGRVIFVAARQVATDWHIYVTITDATGTAVVPEFDLGAVDISGSACAVTSDGTAFFAACGRSLFRIALDGTHSVATSTKTFSGMEFVTWGGTTGWFGAQTGAQRFDATGALLGTPLSFSQADAYATFLGDGDDLIGLSMATRPELRRIMPGGAVSSPVEVGAGPAFAGLARVGGDVFVAWSPSRLQVALVVPP